MLEQELRRPRRWDRWVGARKPSADTLGRVLAGLSLRELRQLTVAIAEGLRTLVEPQVISAAARTTRLWDLAELTTFTTLGRAVRVVWAEEQTSRGRVVGGQRQTIVEDKRWIWVTDLPAGVVPATTIQRWGHARWDLETRGFGELTTLWHLDHCFIHDPTAIEALLLTLAVAFLTTYLFYARTLKPAARRHLTRLGLAARLREEFALLAGATIWPAVQRSD